MNQCSQILEQMTVMSWFCEKLLQSLCKHTFYKMKKNIYYKNYLKIKS